MSGKLNIEIGECIRKNFSWPNLPVHIKQILKNSPKDYDRCVFNYSLKNQLRYKGNLVRRVFRNEQRYYELLVEKSISNLSIFPYHLADIVTKGLRYTPFNYYVDVISFLLKNDKSYDTLPNFTAIDCLRVLGIGRNEYLTVISELKTNSSKLFRKPNPISYLPKFPVRINIEPWWKAEVGYVLESDIKYVSDGERSSIDDLIDYGSQAAGQIDYCVIHALYRKGLIYLDVPISGEDRIAIPPLKNFVMNRVSGDYFENLLYKVFMSVDEYMTISELSQMLQVSLDSVKYAVSLFCRLGFANKKTEMDIQNIHNSWNNRDFIDEPLQVTPLNYHSLLINEKNDGIIPNKNSESPSPTSSIKKTLHQQQQNSEKEKSPEINISSECISLSDGNSDFSFLNSNQDGLKSSIKSTSDELSSGMEDTIDIKPIKSLKSGKRIGFLFDSTLTAFLMMGNLSPGLKNHAVTLFEVGKLCDESMDTFLSELEKVSLLDAEGEGEVGRYFAHAVILRSTICALRNILEGGLDLLRLECLESLDFETRNRLLEKKYKFLISAAPLTSSLTNIFSIPVFGQFYKSSESSHLWSKVFYYHITGYGPPSLLLIKGTILKYLPRIFLGYGKLLITIIHTDSYIINSESFKSLNDQLRNNCVLIQGYGIKKPGEIKYESFPVTSLTNNPIFQKLSKILNLENTCGYLTFVNTGVLDIGCENYDINVHLERPKSKKDKKPITLDLKTVKPTIDLYSPMDGSEITDFKKTDPEKLKSPDEDYFAVTPLTSNSPSNIFRSIDCNEILANELAQLDDVGTMERSMKQLVSQSSIEISIDQSYDDCCERNEFAGEEWTLLDVNFGVPLFDVDCNTRICERIAKDLKRDENLQKLQDINKEMSKKFMTFISQCLYFDDENIVFKIGKIIPQPRINLVFDNGKIVYWNGK